MLLSIFFIIHPKNKGDISSNSPPPLEDSIALSACTVQRILSFRGKNSTGSGETLAGWRQWRIEELLEFVFGYLTPWILISTLSISAILGKFFNHLGPKWT